MSATYATSAAPGETGNAYDALAQARESIIATRTTLETLLPNLDCTEIVNTCNAGLAQINRLMHQVQPRTAAAGVGNDSMLGLGNDST